MGKRRTVITGMGIVSPIGNNIQEFQTSLFNGCSGIKEIPELSEIGLKCKVGGICNIDIKKLISQFPQLDIPVISRSTHLLIQAASEALKDAKLVEGVRLLKTDIDIIIGSTIGAGDIYGEHIIKNVDSQNQSQLGSFAFEQIINSSPAAMLSGIFNTTGRVISNSLACASSTESISDAVSHIKYQNKNIVLCGGVDPYSKYYWSTMDVMRIINRNHNNDPEKASRPMSSSARGFVPAEGSAVLVIEEYEHAKNRNANIYGEIIGTHVNTGGQTNGGSMTAGNQEMLIKCISKAIIDAEIDINYIDYISGHLTGTKADTQEILAWKTIFNKRKKGFPHINSTKSMTGHTMGACGAIETIATILQMNNSFIHKSLNCEDLHPEIATLIPKHKVPQKTISNINIEHAITANFGFGDVNACIILKKHNG